MKVLRRVLLIRSQAARRVLLIRSQAVDTKNLTTSWSNTHQLLSSPIWAQVFSPLPGEMLCKIPPRRGMLENCFPWNPVECTLRAAPLRGAGRNHPETGLPASVLQPGISGSLQNRHIENAGPLIHRPSQRCNSSHQDTDIAMDTASASKRPPTETLQEITRNACEMVHFTTTRRIKCADDAS